MNSCYFDNQIRPQLLKLISTSNIEIIAAVAWFTDVNIFSALQNALQRGVKLRLLFQEDDINSNAPFDVGDLAIAGAQVWLWNPLVNGTMHHKFIVVDSSIIMAGSYNWTVAASSFNKENVMVLSGIEAPVSDYVKVFESLCIEAVLHSRSPKSIITEIEFKDVKSSIRVQILELESLISGKEQEKADLQSVIDRFLNRLRQRLGNIILRELLLKTEVANLQAQITGKRTDSETYEELKEEYARNQKTIEADKNRDIPTLPEDKQLSMKKMFREAVFAAHPDHFNGNPEKEAKANSLTARLNEAYRQSDFETVREIWQSLKDGTAFGVALSEIEDLGRLELMLVKLRIKLQNLVKEINSIKSDELYIVAKDRSSWEDWFFDYEKKIKDNIEMLIEQISKLKSKSVI